MTGLPNDAAVAAALALIVDTSRYVLVLVTTVLAAAPVRLSVTRVPAELMPMIVQVTPVFDVLPLTCVIFAGMGNPQLVA